jgi:ribonuclease MRP protein subunit SNM1
MEKDKGLRPNQITSLHLYELVHSAPLNPLTHKYTKTLTSYNDEKSINLPPSLDYKICNNCGNLLIPGLNMSIKIVFPKVKKNETKKVHAKTINVITQPKSDSDDIPDSTKRYLQIKCSKCKHKTRDYSLKNYKVKPSTFKAEWTPEPKENDKVTKPNRAKERSKKRKKNSLTAMLENKQKDSNKGLNSLNLMDLLGN